jgi:hypothetical protein
MFENSLPHADNEAIYTRYLADLRVLGYSMVADAYEHLFRLGILFFDTSGRIVEAGVPTSAEETA